MSTAGNTTTFAAYIEQLSKSSPEAALKIAVAETERQRALAAEKAEEYRAMSDVAFDGAGRIAHATMGGLWRLAQVYSGSQIVPEHYRGKPHDCFVACQMAMRLKVDPFAYMQSSYVVHGKPGIEAKLAIAMLNTSGKIKGRVQYEFSGSGDDRRCVAFATDKETGEVVEADVTWRMVKEEGWLAKSGSKWKTMPDVMFRYRSAAFLIRGYYPEVLTGVALVDELEDIADEPREPTRRPERAVASLDTLTEILNQQAETPVEQATEARTRTAESCVDLLTRAIAQIASAATALDANALRDNYLGPDSTIEWTPEEAAQIDAALAKRVEELAKPKRQKAMA